MVSAVVVTIKGLLSDCEGRSNCWTVLVTDSSGGEMSVDMVHGWDYGCNGRGTITREKKSRIFKNLSSNDSNQST